MRKRNWRDYNKQLVQRGSLTFLIDPKVIKTLKVKKKKGVGRPEEFSNSLIQILLTMKIHFRLTYRALEGFAKSIIGSFIKKLKMPTYSLICKRVSTLGISIPKLSNRRPSTIIVDSTGMKVVGEGEWKVKIHGRGRPRKWMKVHIAIDPVTQEVIAELTTENNIGDSKMMDPLLSQVSNSVMEVLADGAYDRQHARDAIKKKGARPVIPPPRNARYRGTGDERDHAVITILGMGNDQRARSLWGKLTGYNRRVLVETAFSSMKRMFGDRFFSKTIERQMVENRVRCLLLNKMRGIGSVA